MCRNLTALACLSVYSELLRGNRGSLSFPFHAAESAGFFCDLLRNVCVRVCS